MEQLHRKYNRNFALLVLFSTLAAYFATVAPTVAFWDCGEYIGSSHSLGIPHPPGNPLYVLLGRVFSILFFFFDQIAFRVNLISVASGALTAMFIYLIIVRAMISWMGIPDVRWKRINIYLSGIIGGWFCAFGYTFWFSAVEASVYLPSMLVVVISAWIAIKWAQSTDKNRDKLLILFSYVAFLGIGVHMMSMLALIPVFLFVLLSDETKLKDWRLWVTCLAMGTVIYHVSAFFLLGPITVIVTFAMSFIEKSAKKKWRLCFWIAFFALMGYSVHIYIPIRSTARPIIDENHPIIEINKGGSIKWDAFKGFLERKQYGSESMIVRMFWRLGAFDKQFGIDGHMGYGGFHLTQFFHFGKSIYIDRNKTVVQNWGQAEGMFKLLLYMIPTFIMLFGWGYLWKRNRNMAMLLIFLFVMGSIILVLYMNFADGTRPMKRDYMAWMQAGKQGNMPLQHREVRIRDYFWTSGFAFFGMWIGIAMGCMMHLFFTHKNDFIRKHLAPIMVVLFAVTPVLPFTQNFSEHNRTKDWIPYDYAYNLLMSCKKNGILFTNGDNDTFPLWFLQEAEGIRRDVRIVNLSLLNTKWYITQLKMLEPKVPIKYSYKEIEDRVNHGLNPFTTATSYRMPSAGIGITIPGRDTKRIFRIQDYMTLNIVDATNWSKPIYFAVTVSDDNLLGLKPYLEMQGLVYEVKRNVVPVSRRLNLEKTLFLLDRVYSFRSLGDNTAPVTETGRKLMSNYAASFIQIALTLRQPLGSMRAELTLFEKMIKDSLTTFVPELLAEKQNELGRKKNEYDKTLNIVLDKLDQCVAIMPWDWRPRLLRQEYLMGHGMLDLAMEKLDEALSIEPSNGQYKKLKVRLFELLGKKGEANNLLKKIASTEDDPAQSYVVLAHSYEQMGLYDSAIAMMRQYQNIRPGDRQAEMMIKRYEKSKAAKEASGQRIDTVEKIIEKEQHSQG